MGMRRRGSGLGLWGHEPYVVARRTVLRLSLIIGFLYSITITVVLRLVLLLSGREVYLKSQKCAIPSHSPLSKRR
jgi:hypothetical protein